MKDFRIHTTAGEIFGPEDHGQLARLIYKRFGRDLPAATAAWYRLLQSGPPSEAEFQELLKLPPPKIWHGYPYIETAGEPQMDPDPNVFAESVELVKKGLVETALESYENFEWDREHNDGRDTLHTKLSRLLELGKSNEAFEKLCAFEFDDYLGVGHPACPEFKIEEVSVLTEATREKP